MRRRQTGPEHNGLQTCSSPVFVFTVPYFTSTGANFLTLMASEGGILKAIFKKFPRLHPGSSWREGGTPSRAQPIMPLRSYGAPCTCGRARINSWRRHCCMVLTDEKFSGDVNSRRSADSELRPSVDITWRSGVRLSWWSCSSAWLRVSRCPSGPWHGVQLWSTTDVLVAVWHGPRDPARLTHTRTTRTTLHRRQQTGDFCVFRQLVMFIIHQPVSICSLIINPLTPNVAIWIQL